LSLFWRYFFISAITLLLMLVVAFATSMFLRSIDHKRMIENGPLFFAHLLANRKGSRVEIVKSLNRYRSPFFPPMPGFRPPPPPPPNRIRPPVTPFEFDLIDSAGKSLVTGRPHWSPDKYPHLKFTQNVLQVQRLDDSDVPQQEMVIKLDKDTDQYLLVTFKTNYSTLPRYLLASLLTMMVAVLLASAVSSYFLFLSFRQKARLAEKVIAELQHGNLKSRFPVSKIDEFTQVMGSFNKMADEIERLVLGLKENEKERVGLLQELAHDLRTPVASLKNLMETFKDNFNSMGESTRDEVLSLSIEEIKYFERLVEDLLFLGQVMEPKYHEQSEDVDFADIVKDQLSVMRQKYPEIRVSEMISDEAARQKILGDEQLLRRLIRNGLENSCSFSKQEVQVELKMSEDLRSLELSIRDDGPGLTPEALASFGKKRTTRTYQAESSSRLSVGLGSVIMIAVAQLHGGFLQIRNRSAVEPGISGAELIVRLPVRAGA
jgi:signal transduction histidine kinase